MISGHLWPPNVDNRRPFGVWRGLCLRQERGRHSKKHEGFTCLLFQFVGKLKHALPAVRLENGDRRDRSGKPRESEHTGYAPNRKDASRT